MERRRRKVQHDICAGLGKPHRGLGHPDVLADGDRAALASDRHQQVARARLEVALLVEDAVVRQQTLVVDRLDRAVAHQRRSVAETAVGAVNEPDERGDLRRSGELAQRVEGTVHEVRPREQVLRRIAGKRELGQDHEVGPHGGGDRGETSVEIALDVPHGGVDLCECDAHAPSLSSRRRAFRDRARPARRSGYTSPGANGRSAMRHVTRLATFLALLALAVALTACSTTETGTATFTPDESSRA